MEGFRNDADLEEACQADIEASRVAIEGLADVDTDAETFDDEEIDADIFGGTG